MRELADEFFETKNDPAQITVTEEIIGRLREIHPATLTEESEADGPIAWILVIPTTFEVMEEFVDKTINERELLTSVIPGQRYDAVYLCSALVLPEHRGKGLARRLAVKAVRAIQKEHPIIYLFYWSFSVEGDRLANSLAREFDMPLFRRPPD